MDWLTGWLRAKAPAQRQAGDATAGPPSGGPPNRPRRAKTYRRFADAAGVTWHVWEVDPREAERRRAVRRIANEARKGSPMGYDRRRRESRLATRPGYENGWLAFASTEGAKRLAPIPSGWAALPDGALDELRCRAVDAEQLRHRPGREQPPGPVPLNS